MTMFRELVRQFLVYIWILPVKYKAFSNLYLKKNVKCYIF